MHCDDMATGYALMLQLPGGRTEKDRGRKRQRVRAFVCSLITKYKLPLKDP